ncbi:Uncharacterised protein [Mycobacteroides abscessus subsp. abscessus]|nr:Uncharacterised protein [Mycobacteroides abscessus subsp. abscessus]
MRTGFATPVRRPWFHRAHGTRRSQASIAVAAIVALSAFTTACADNSPVSAPTSTLPAPQPSETASSPSVPEYTTDLDLTDEEKEAVEGALVAFDGFFRVVNRAYKGDYEATKEFSRYARGEALESIQGDSQVIEDGSYVFTGNVEPTKVAVTKFDGIQGSASPERVNVQFCFDLTKWSLAPKNETPTLTSDFATMEHEITYEDGSWKVAAQTLKDRSC